MLLEQGRRYHAIVKIGWPKSMGATVVKVAEFFRNYGFDLVTVNGCSGLFSAEGVWSKPNANVELPSQIISAEPL